MGYGRCVGYIGALAVALGVGSAVATPGIAYGLPADTGSESPTPGETSPTDPSPPSSPTTSPSSTKADAHLSPNDLADNGLRLLGPDLASRVAGAVSKIIGGDRGAPVVVLRSSGGAHSATNGSDAKKSAATTGLPVGGDDDAGPSLPTALKRPLRVLGDGAPTQTVTARNADSGAPTAVRSSRIVGMSVPTPRLAPDATGPAMKSLVAPPTLVVPAPLPDLGDVLEEPHTHLVGVVAHVAGAVLNVVLTPFGPGSPAQSPVLWTVLAFVRDEFERPFLPTAASGQTTSSLNHSPNLLVNPGAEAGDPSLSGYAAVTVPGWTQTGTPTVIKYGTQRRFPVPTASPGPVLPSFFAFPSGDNAIPTPAEGQQFFGGGPVADSTLTQTVDLSAAHDLIDAGDGTYTLSGDLGGFLIDPSRSAVSVNFLDENGNKLGTGTLKPVSAWDRLFATGFIHRTTSSAIPVGTRSAQVVVAFDDQNPVLGNYNNAYADNLSFTVNDPSLTPGTLAPPVSNVGKLDHVFMVYLENKGTGQIIGSPNAPYLNELIDNYGYASNYYGVTHPSDPNYYPIIGGSDFGFNYNCPSNCFPVGTPNLADRIEATPNGLGGYKNWAGYMEGGGGYSTPTDRLPFLAFADIYNDPERVETHLFDISQMKVDLADPATAPNFVWFAADDETNMEGPTDFPVGIFHWALGFLNPAHQYNVAAGDAWLEDQVKTITESATWNDPNVKSAIFITFDEDYNNITTGVGNEGNHIVMIVIPSPGAAYDPVTNPTGMRSGAFVADDYYNHYSLQRTIEDSLGVAPLTNNDKYAQPMNEFWGPPPPV